VWNIQPDIPIHRKEAKDAKDFLYHNIQEFRILSLREACDEAISIIGGERREARSEKREKDVRFFFPLSLSHFPLPVCEIVLLLRRSQ